METIRASEKAIKDVFCDDYVFEIPPYQRPYSWEKEQVNELLDDLIWAAGDKKPTDQPPYFLGSIVLIKDPNYPKADVVDGQQRLTTLTVLISVLRELAAKKSRPDIDIFLKQRGNANLGTKDIPRLTVRERDAEFFRTVIQDGREADASNENNTDARTRMIANRDLLRENLNNLDPALRDRLLPFIAQRCYLVVVEASDQTSAYRIFSVMNDRGMDLSATDILKADVVGAIEGEDEQARHNEIWESLEDGLGRDAFGDLFAHLRMIHRRQKMRGTLEREFKQYVRPVDRPIDFIGRELKSSAEIFRKIIEPDMSKGSKQYRLLRGLHQIDNQDWQPPLIKFMVDQYGNDAEIDCFLERLDRLAYFLFITRANINQRLHRYGLLLSEIADGASVDEMASLELSAEEVEYLFDWLDDDIYQNQRTRRAILLRLDEMLADGTAHYDHKVVTIEHVLPQNPKDDSEWVKNFPDEEFRDNWVHSIANLVLLSKYKNPAASNYDFEKKKNVYFAEDGDSSFVLTNQVREREEWTPEVLEVRRERLLRKVAQKWNIDFPDDWFSL